MVVEFINWLREHNSNLSAENKVGFYVLDLYSLNASTEIIIKYLEETDINAAEKVKQRYACFDSFKEDLQNYSYAAMLGLTKTCQDEVIAQLVKFNQNAYSNTKENTPLIKNAEKYYRAMLNHKSSWNIRDMHMTETLDKLVQYLSKKLQKPAKIITWAHNSHIGDARATEVRIRGQLNIGNYLEKNMKIKLF